MSPERAGGDGPLVGERIRVRGVVQGVGLRPTVWRLAQTYGLRGSVGNDGDGVLVTACGTRAALAGFVAALRVEAPPLARIDAIEREPLAVAQCDEAAFRIVASSSGQRHTAVAADAATCPECLAEIADTRARRHRYPFTNCTHCGPRLSIVEAVPYDRAATTLRDFALCPECAAEYADPRDRRFHAQAIACPRCGPRAWLTDAAGRGLGVASRAALGIGAAIDEIDAAAQLLGRGQIVAVKGLGGFQLACDAGDEAAVARLRAAKRRERKPFALMARDLAVVRRYAAVDAAEEALLQGVAAPIVILAAGGSQRVAAAVAPGVATLGFMLPNTPLHHLLLQRWERPIVLTSGNLAEEPQCIANAEALARLGAIADYFLLHDRGIARRVDDSVVRMAVGAPRVLRRARGYAPESLPLAAGFASAPPVLALGGELKNSFCLLRDGEAIVSQHLGDLGDAASHADALRVLGDYRRLFDFAPRVVAVDRHPEYRSRKLGLALVEAEGLALEEVQHHHAHLAACLADNGVPRDAPPLLGVVLDGLGYGETAGDATNGDARLWGGEFLLADYRGYRRLATFRPVALPGGAQAVREPWRNTYAQLAACVGWERLERDYASLELVGFLAAKPRASLDAMLAQALNSPLSSSCGRLFDAVAAALGVCREGVAYEGQAAVELEALVDARALSLGDAAAYPFAVGATAGGLPCVEAQPMWLALLRDLAAAAPLPLIAARFHLGLARAVVDLVERLAPELRAQGGTPGSVALAGGVFHNRVLFELICARLERAGWRVLSMRRVPAGDGGLALGQAAVAAARLWAAAG